MRILYYQCPAGLSGDMNLGAMAALGVNPAELETELKKLNLDGWEIHFEPDSRGGVTGMRCDVVLDDGTGHKHGHDDHGHGHEHEHEHHHRTFADIRAMIEASTLSAKVKRDAVAIFEALAEAEGAVHGKPPEEVHFHEVGAVDSIVDIVGAAISWELLDVDHIVCGTLELGGGTVMCAHGRMPVPAPATARLVDGLPVSLGATNQEATTPTGAALLVGKRAKFGAAISGTTLAHGVGVGQRDDPQLANVVYATLLECDDETPPADCQDIVWELAANLDDMTGESVAFLCDALLDGGALDVWQTSATFKKGRVGVIVHALAPLESIADLEEIFFVHSSTLGVRRKEWRRSKLERAEMEVETEWGVVRVKQAIRAGEVVRLKPEFEDCARIAREHGFTLAEIHQLLAANLFKVEDEAEEENHA